MARNMHLGIGRRGRGSSPSPAISVEVGCAFRSRRASANTNHLLTALSIFVAVTGWILNKCDVHHIFPKNHL